MTDASLPDEPSLDIDILIEDERWDEVTGLEDLTRKAVSMAASVAGAELGNMELCILFTDDDEIRKLNAEFRDKDKPTNVLSFPSGETPLPDGAPVMLGDIVLASGVVFREAEEQGKPLANHVLHLIVHGMLHLLGYDHEQDDEAEIMEALEIEALARLGLPNPYAEGNASVMVNN
jgi:probable rRNA maturation factor